MPGRTETIRFGFTNLVELELKLHEHEIEWDIVGEKLAHGHCIHYHEPVVVAREQRMYMKLGNAFSRPCVPVLTH
jgi:hypothetical protein